MLCIITAGCLTGPVLSLFRYTILDKDCPIGINPITGQLFTLRKLDRELQATHMFQVKAQEDPDGRSHIHTKAAWIY